VKKVISEKKNILSNYINIYDYVKRRMSISSLSLDEANTYDLNLFTVDSEFDLEKEEKIADYVLKTLGSIKRIFAKPLIDLIDVDNVMPVEAVKKIFARTISYSTSHINTIDDVFEDGNVKPRKLMSVEYKLLYETYENQVFTQFINLIIKYCKRNMMILNNYLFMDAEKLNVNILERLHHLFYYVAIGKLHTGYIRNFTNKYDDVKRLNNKILRIYDTITARLNSPVYKENNKRSTKKKNLKLKKTNIFRSQKDYKKVFNLYRFFLINNIGVETYIDEEDRKKLQDYYFYYVELISLFSITHYNFKFAKTCRINFKQLDVNFKFQGYKLNLKRKNIKGLSYLEFTFFKTKKYKVALIPLADQNKRREYSKIIKGKKDCDLYIYTSPFMDTVKDMYLSINNVDSFRRIQQLCLKGMIYSDTKRDVCPFCGGKLTKFAFKDKKDTEYVCEICKTEIKKVTCPTTNKPYYITDIKNYKYFIASDLYRKEVLKQRLRNINQNDMFYRNICDLNAEQHNICPYCGGDHDL